MTFLLLQIAGQYILKATVSADAAIDAVLVKVQVLPCPRGSVATGKNDTCITCVAGNPFSSADMRHGLHVMTIKNACLNCTGLLSCSLSAVRANVGSPLHDLHRWGVKPHLCMHPAGFPPFRQPVVTAALASDTMFLSCCSAQLKSRKQTCTTCCCTCRPVLVRPHCQQGLQHLWRQLPVSRGRCGVA